jgi:type I restriction enzyme M protein
LVAVDLQDPSRRLYQAANHLWTGTALRPDHSPRSAFSWFKRHQRQANFHAVYAELAKALPNRPVPTAEDHSEEKIWSHQITRKPQGLK